MECKNNLGGRWKLTQWWRGSLWCRKNTIIEGVFRGRVWCRCPESWRWWRFQWGCCGCILCCYENVVGVVIGWCCKEKKLKMMTRSVLWGWWEFDDGGGDGRKFCIVVVCVVRIDEDRKCYVVCYCSVFGERKREVDGVKEEDVVVWVVNVYSLMTMLFEGR